MVVKIPATVPGYTAAAHLRAEGIPILLTAVYSASQGLLADALDCGWIAPYVGRITDLGHDGVAEVSTLSQMLRERRSSCRVLAASIRDVSQMTELAAAGSKTSRSLHRYATHFSRVVTAFRLPRPLSRMPPGTVPEGTLT